jgi:glucose-6-phosphate isomerase
MEHVYLDFTHAIRKKKDVERFFSVEEIEQISNRIQQAHEEIQQECSTEENLSFLSLPYAYRQEDGATILGDILWKVKEHINQKVRFIRNNCSDHAQIAIGGSALGAIALFNAMADQLDLYEKQPKLHIFQKS